MPFIQRIVEPIHVSRVEVEKNVTDELECVTNHSLANIIRQLSSLSQHAEDMFSDLYRETSAFFTRATNLNSRVEHLRFKVTQLNPTEEEVSLQDIHLRKPYQSSKQHDQQVVSRITIPKAIQDVYNRCEKPPCLDKLNVYREDGKDCMKFYTDPSYFFELWYSEIKKDIENRKKEVKAKRVKKNRSPGGHKQINPKQVQSKVDKYKDQRKGKEFCMDYQVPTIQTQSSQPHVPHAGYTREGTGHRPEQLNVNPGGDHATADQTQHLVGQTNLPDGTNNHIDNQTMNGPYNVHPQYQTDQQDQNYNAQMQYQASQPAQDQSSRDRRQSQRPGANVASPSRPQVAPPPPPPMDQGCIQRSDRASMSPQRESLPPPPPPPPLENGYPNTPQMRNPQLQQLGFTGGSPRHVPTARDSELPPPPPPPMMSPDTPEMPPPPSPPPSLHRNTPPPPPPLQQNHAPPPPPIPPPVPITPMNMMNGQQDTMSVSSENSTYSSTASALEGEAPSEPPKLNDRNALLEQIRRGDCNKKLRKTEEKQKETVPKDRFDVHAVMTRAFDIRRKAMEDSESEGDDDDEEDWCD